MFSYSLLMTTEIFTNFFEIRQNMLVYAAHPLAVLRGYALHPMEATRCIPRWQLIICKFDRTLAFYEIILLEGCLFDTTVLIPKAFATASTWKDVLRIIIFYRPERKMLEKGNRGSIVLQHCPCVF